MKKNIATIMATALATAITAQHTNMPMLSKEISNKLEIKTQAYSNTVSGKNAGRFLNQRQKRLLARRRNHRK